MAYLTILNIWMIVLDHHRTSHQRFGEGVQASANCPFMFSQMKSWPAMPINNPFPLIIEIFLKSHMRHRSFPISNIIIRAAVGLKRTPTIEKGQKVRESDF